MLRTARHSHGGTASPPSSPRCPSSRPPLQTPARWSERPNTPHPQQQCLLQPFPRLEHPSGSPWTMSNWASKTENGVGLLVLLLTWLPSEGTGLIHTHARHRRSLQGTEMFFFVQPGRRVSKESCKQTQAVTSYSNNGK